MVAALSDYPAIVGSVFGALALVAVQWLRGRQGKVEKKQVDQQTLLHHYEATVQRQGERIDELEIKLNAARDEIRRLRNGK